MSKNLAHFVDAGILLWNPDLLWARYLEVLVKWKADPSSGKIHLPVFNSPTELGDAMQLISDSASCGRDPEKLQLRWEILLHFGYDASKEFLKWTKCETEKITKEAIEFLLKRHPG